MTEKTRERLEYKLNCYVGLYTHRDYIARQQKSKRKISEYSLSDETREAAEIHRLTLYPAENITQEDEKRIKAYLLLHLRELDEAENCLKENQPELYKHYQEIGLTE